MSAPDYAAPQLSDPPAAETEFGAHHPGAYVFGLTATDEQEATTELRVTLYSDYGLPILVKWSLESDPDPTDLGAMAGADLDVRFMHHGSGWSINPGRADDSDCSPSVRRLLAAPQHQEMTNAAKARWVLTTPAGACGLGAASGPLVPAASGPPPQEAQRR